jgi:hypothetical protein
MDHLFWGRLKKRYFVFFGSEFLNIYLLPSEELLAFQEGLCDMKLDTYYICILEIYYCLCHDPACEDIIAVFSAKVMCDVTPAFSVQWSLSFYGFFTNKQKASSIHWNGKILKG